MPMYTHKCDTCERLVAVLCPIADRDKPKSCSAYPLAVTGVPIGPVFGKREPVMASVTDCPGTLTRPAGDVDATAYTPYGWKP